MRVRWPKWLKWEFWPWWFFYGPIYPYWFWLGLRMGRLSFFTAANPGLYMGGFIAYSKWAVLRQLPEQYVPKTHFFEHIEDAQHVRRAMQALGVEYPVILKPDVGERGFGVAKIDNEAQLAAYLARYPREGVLLQAYIAAPREYGVLFSRLPDGSDAPGRVSSIVEKVMLAVTGDGKRTLLQLMQADERCRYHLQALEEEYASKLDEVLPPGKTRQLTSIGNHVRGATFRDATALISEALVARFAELSQHVEGFYFGRYDLRCHGPEDLAAGRFKVVELNGVNSEPGHIYDPHYPLLRAYRHLFAHWGRIGRISRQNLHRGAQAAPLKALWAAVRGQLDHKKRVGG